MAYTTTTTPSIPGEVLLPPQPPGPILWVRKNLFSTWYNSLLSLVSLVVIVWAGYNAAIWVFTVADWRPVYLHPVLYMVGLFPREQMWRIGISLATSSFLMGVSMRYWGGPIRVVGFTYILFIIALGLWPAEAQALTPEIRFFLLGNVLLMALGYIFGKQGFLKPGHILTAWLLTSIVGLFLLRGIPGSQTLPAVSTQLWGGLLVTMLLSVGGIVLSFPIGVLLALGRRSSLPVVRILSTVFIEVVRGVPLIGILFLSSLILPLFLPTHIRIDRLLRALIGITLFSAAYMAENVRGGLAAVPLGQVEAAKAVGLTNIKITFLIVLPQALRAVIPPIVGQFIALFKDTTLVAGIAVLELLSVGLSILQGNTEYFGLQMEVLLFIAAVFWILCWLMSYASLKLEKALGVGTR
jgi:general L-amino acid transport system permease protein